MITYIFFFSSRRRHTRYWRDWSSDVCSSDLILGNGNHSAQRHHVDPYGIVTALLFRAEENLKVSDKCGCKLSQGNVTQTIACLDKFFQVLVNGTILVVCGIATQTGRHLLGKILIVPGIDRQQCLVSHLQTQESVFYFLRRDI